MEQRLKQYLSGVFSRSLSAYSLETNVKVMVPLELDGRKRKADIYECLLKGPLVRLYIRKIYAHSSVFQPPLEENLYELDRKPVSPYSLEEVLGIMKENGYEIPSHLEGRIDDTIPVQKTFLKRGERGVKSFFDNLKYQKIRGELLRLEYRKEEEGSFVLRLEIDCDKRVDTGRLECLDLGFLDYYKEVGREKKDRLLRYLSLLSSFNMYAGLESVDIIDYLTIIEKMQMEKGDEDYSLEIEKRRIVGADEPGYGGEGYLSFGKTLTPLEFAWYVGGFRDTPEQRRAFFAYYDEMLRLEEAKGCDKEESYYLSVLGLKAGASEEDIREAYKRKAKAFHPDSISSLDLDAEFTEFAKARMQMINEAYQALKNR